MVIVASGIVTDFEISFLLHRGYVLCSFLYFFFWGIRLRRRKWVVAVLMVCMMNKIEKKREAYG